MIRLKLQLIVILLLLVGVIGVSAGSPHFIGSLTISFGSLHVSGDLAGLGNMDITVRLDAYANIIAQCQNRGGNTAPGRNPVFVSTVVSASAIPDSNGRASIVLVALDPLTISPLPPSPSPKTAGCPNGNWNVNGFVSGSTQWTGAQISVIENPTGALLLQENYICSGSGTSLTCTKR
jgi:hypothetical protein